MNDDKITVALTEDKQEQCENNYMITNTGFLDMRQQSLCQPSLSMKELEG